MFLRLDNAEIPGLFSIDGYIDIRDLPDSEVASDIMTRLRMLDPVPTYKTTFRTFTSNLPAVDSLLIGREKELEFLDQAWANPKTNIVQVIAPGGTGKTALMDKWYKSHLDECTIFGWSFYSQGVREDSQTSSDPFFAEILPFFGLIIPQGASVWARAEAIAQRLREERVLLILDGLEPLQESTGEIRDSAMKALLLELRTRNKGMVLCTTRVYVKDLPVDELSPTCNLQNLESRDGASLLYTKGVRGTQQELEHASTDFHNHALAVTLLGTYLKEFHDGDIRCRTDIRGLLTGESDQDGHANRVVAGYVKMFKGKPELDVLNALGYFDRPTEPDALRLILRRTPEKLTLIRLKKLGLILTSNPSEKIDCHPLVREYFAKVMGETAEKEFKAGHSLLYEHYSNQAPKRPDTREGMVELFYAVYHGCQAGKHQEVCVEIYRDRINHGDGQFYLTKKLGEWGTELSLLANFFKVPWVEPTRSLRPTVQSWVIGQAAVALRALGRLGDAVAPMQVAADDAVDQKDWRNATRRYNNLSELHTSLGSLQEAVTSARHAVRYADQAEDQPWRYASRASLAAAFHQSGDLAEAERLFGEAESMKRELNPSFPYLESLSGYQFCNYLLDEGQQWDVIRRGSATLKVAEKHSGPLDIGLAHLSLGRACAPGSPESHYHIAQAVTCLRTAGELDYLAAALLACSELRNLEEAFSIAFRSCMPLHLADYHLILGGRLKSLEHFNEAEELINATGYGRRKPALEELRNELNAP
jgi:tetratricopeptide (TPR) repeat protein